MKTIFVQIKCAPGAAYEVAAQLADWLDPAPEVHSTSGQWDLLIKCVLPAETDIGRFVTERVQTVKGVRETFTTVAYKAFVRDSSE